MLRYSKLKYSFGELEWISINLSNELQYYSLQTLD